MSTLTITTPRQKAIDADLGIFLTCASACGTAVKALTDGTQKHSVNDIANCCDSLVRHLPELLRSGESLSRLLPDQMREARTLLKACNAYLGIKDIHIQSRLASDKDLTEISSLTLHSMLPLLQRAAKNYIAGGI